MSDDAARHTLGPLPRIEVQIAEDRTSDSRCDRGFLRVRRLQLRNRYSDGTESAVYPYDVVDRDALDAVAIVLYTRDRRVCLRSSLRPPLALRGDTEIETPVCWEVPAGLIEPEEFGEEGLRVCCARETLEEVGLVVEPGAFVRLGGATVLSPGVIAERLHYFAACVDESTRGIPTEDGSPVEERAEVRFIDLEDALEACRTGVIADIKTELSIRRLREHVEVSP